MALPVAAALAAVVVVADKVRVVAIRPKAPRSPVAIKPRVRRRIRPKVVVAPLEEDERQLLRGNPASLACLATCQSSR